MHRRCSPDSRFCRYLVVTKEVGPANVRRLLTETATTVAEALDGQLVAMGNVCLGGAEAELALLVEDGWHRRGLGVCLACVLAGQAVESGARVLTATVIGTNVAIRQTLAAAGLAPVIVAADAGILELHCDLLRWAPAVSPSPGMAAAAVGPPAAAGPDGHPECDPECDQGLQRVAAGPKGARVSFREEMLNRKSVTLGLAGLGLAGALAGGAGIAAAATGATTTTPTTASTVATPPYRDGGLSGMASGMSGMASGMSGMASGMSGMASGMSGMASGVNSPITAAASYLGLSRTDLQTQLQAGKSLADVAQAQGKSVSGLEGAMVAAIKSNLDANTTLTADQKAAILAQVKSHIDTMVNTTHPSGAGIGSMGARMSGMRR